MEQSRRLRHRHQRGALRAAARVTEDRHVRGDLPPNSADVVAHPLEREDQIELAGVARIDQIARSELGEMKIAERVQSMVDGDDDDVAACGSDRAPSVSSSLLVPLEYAPPWNQTMTGRLRVVAEAWRPDIEMQAVFAHRAPAGRRLRCNRTEFKRIADAGPRIGRDGRKKTAPARVGAVANAFEDVNAGVGATAPLALRGIENRPARLRRGYGGQAGLRPREAPINGDPATSTCRNERRRILLLCFLCFLRPRHVPSVA